MTRERETSWRGFHVHAVELRVFGARGTARHKAHSAEDEGNAEPAGEGQVLAEEQVAHEGDDDVTERGRGSYEAEVGPTERSGVGREKADEQDNAEVDRRVKEGVPEEAKVLKVDRADLTHAAREKSVADGSAERDDEQDHVLRRFEAVLHVTPV